jgi:hypothetical protein
VAKNKDKKKISKGRKKPVVGNTMWGGRFASGPAAIMEKINTSIDFDWHLYRQDIAASKAHAEMLAKQGIITADDARKIAHGLDTILSEIGSGKFKFNRALEDIHMNVESRLSGLIGPAARSRPISGCGSGRASTTSTGCSPTISGRWPRRRSSTPVR